MLGEKYINLQKNDFYVSIRLVKLITCASSNLSFKLSSMRNLPLPLFLTFLSFCFCLSLRAIDSKGAIIIASMEGQVTVTNNESGTDLASDRIKVGGLLFDGHTVKTGSGI